MSVTTPCRVRKLEDGRLDHFFPDANEDKMYILADPSFGSEMHHARNSIAVSSIELALHLVREHGFSIRMRGSISRQWNLIAASKIDYL